MRHRAIAGALIILAAGCEQPGSEGTVDVPVIELNGGTEFPESFWRLGNVIELDSTRVLAHDPGERLLYVVDFRLGTRMQTGSVGSGPLEYRFPGLLLAAAGVEPVYHDMGQRRLLYFSREGVPSRTWRYVADSSVPAASEILPMASDSRGTVCGTPTARRRASTGESNDSVRRIGCVNASTGTARDLFALRASPGMMQTTRGDDGQLVLIIRVTDFLPGDVWTLLPDGRGVSLRDGDYRVHFVNLDGSESRGPPVPHEAIPVTAADRENAMATANTLARGQDGTGVRVVIQEPARFAETKPAYQDIMASPDSRLWVHKPYVPPDSIRNFDVLDDAGRLIARVRLEPRERLVGLGHRRVYTVRADTDGLAWLKRHELPW